MSDKRKRAIRARMAETGLNYVAAMSQIDAEWAERQDAVESDGLLPAEPSTPTGSALDVVFLAPADGTIAS